MVLDLKITLDNRPGTLAEICETLGKANINIDGICGFAREVKAGEDKELITHTAHILVENFSASKILKEAGINVVKETDALVLEVENKPGELGKICRRLANAGINIEFFYAATNNRIVMGFQDLNKARSVLQN